MKGEKGKFAMQLARLLLLALMFLSEVIDNASRRKLKSGILPT
jgi:hypothetical protein